MTRPTRALIDSGALRHNLRRAREAAPAARVLAVIKANGYGHGLVRAAEALGEAEAFGVACLEEGAALREAGIAHPVVLLEGFYEANELSEIARHRLSIVVHDEYQLRVLETARVPHPLSVWLKVDSGMHRLGFLPEAVAGALHRLQSARSVLPRVRLMTHLASAEARDGAVTAAQLAAFRAATEGIDAERSIANSAAVLQSPEAHADWIRPGLMLYGASPFDDTVGRDEGLRPAMRLVSRLIAVNRLRRGDAVAYGGEWVCPEDMPIGVVAAGYGDGYPRGVKGASVWIDGRRAPVVGRVCMDMLCVDLRAHPGVEVGAEVELWGTNIPVEEVARRASTIPWELLCGVTSRVRFEPA